MDQGQNLFSDDELKEIFEKDVLVLIGGQNLPDEKKADLYLKMAETVQDRVMMRIDEALDGQARQDWITILDSGDQIKAGEFLQNKNLDIAKMMVEEALIYKMELVSLMKLAKQGSSEE